MESSAALHDGLAFRLMRLNADRGDRPVPARRKINCMKRTTRDMVVLAASVVIVFITCVLIGMQFVLSPMSKTDALVVGAMATMFALGTLFSGLIATIFRGTNPLFQRRHKEQSEDPPKSKVS